MSLEFIQATTNDACNNNNLDLSSKFENCQIETGGISISGNMSADVEAKCGEHRDFDDNDDDMLMRFSDEEDCESNTSSLETASEEGVEIDVDDKCMGGHCKEEELGSSASCSVDSFELKSPLEVKEIEWLQNTAERAKEGPSKLVSLAEELENIETPEDSEQKIISPPLSPSDSGVGASASSTSGHESTTSTGKKKGVAEYRTKESIKEELSKLDTSLPQLDFDKLEQQLNNAAREREMRQRKLMSEEVRRRLATDGDRAEWHPPAPTTRPQRSNLATRLQSGMNLQICYMNDAAASHDDARFSSASDSDEEFMSMPKSKSMPISLSAKHDRGLLSNGQLKASDLRKKQAEIDATEMNDSEKRSLRLAEEAQVMMVKAKQAAHMQMEVEKQERHMEHAHILQSIAGLSLVRKRLTRLQLKKFSTQQLQLIVGELNSQIQKLNAELVHFLIDRDSLHMEQDSMLVDVEDLLQHQRAADLKLPEFLVAAPVDKSKPHSTFRIFKR